MTSPTPDPHRRRGRRAVALFRAGARLLPRMGEDALDAASADVEALVERASRRGGRASAWRVTAAALADLAWRIAVERARPPGRTGTRQRTETMRRWARELRQAARGLSHRPGFTAVTAATLGLGIGANVAIFAVVHGVVLRPLDYPDPDRIVVVTHHAPGLDIPSLGQSDGTSALYRDEARSFQAYGAWNVEGRNLAGDAAVPARRVSAAPVTPGIFRVLRVAPALGRGFVEADGAPGAPAVAVLSWGLFQERFGGEDDVLGRSILLDGDPVEVVGVMPRGFDLPDSDVDVMVARGLDPGAGMGSISHEGMARLAPGVTLEAAREELTALQARLPELFEDVDAELLEAAQWGVSVRTIRQAVASGVEETLWILMGAVGLVLLIAAANVANLVLVRAEGRHREVALRTALGAGRGDLVGAFLAESVLLGLAGGVLGLIMAQGTLLVVLALAPDGLPRRDAIGMGGPVLAFGVVLSLAAALVFGVLPLLRARTRELVSGLKEGLRGGTSGRSLRGRNLLVMTQLALALVLLSGSGLLFQSFLQLRRVSPGFEARDVTTAVVSLDRRYREGGQAVAFYRELVREVAALPGVRSVGMIDRVPMAGQGTNVGSFEVEGWDRPADAPPVVAVRKRVLPGYLETMGIALARGSDVTWRDAEERRAVVWVNRELARRFLGDDPVGARIREEEGSPWMEVAGVVEDVREHGFSQPVRPTIYGLPDSPDRGTPYLQMTLVVRGGDPATLPPSLRAILGRMDPGIPLTRVRAMEEVTRAALSTASFSMVLLSLAAALSVALGAVGIYGVISYVVGRRTRELGVRMALGAAAPDVRRMVVGQGMKLAVAGLGVGLMIALLATRALEALLFEVSPADPLVLGSTVAVLLGVSVTATWVPAWRASRVDPVEALHAE